MGSNDPKSWRSARRKTAHSTEPTDNPEELICMKVCWCEHSGKSVFHKKTREMSDLNPPVEKVATSSETFLHAGPSLVVPKFRTIDYLTPALVNIETMLFNKFNTMLTSEEPSYIWPETRLF